MMGMFDQYEALLQLVIVIVPLIFIIGIPWLVYHMGYKSGFKDGKAEGFKQGLFTKNAADASGLLDEWKED